MNKHYYNLHPGPFSFIKSGQKTVEMRLNDEKRKLLRVGDLIVFTNTETKEELTVIVTKLDVFNDFSELYNHFNKVVLGYLADDPAHPNDMEKYYTKSAIEECGVLAINIMVHRT